MYSGRVVRELGLICEQTGIAALNNIEVVLFPPLTVKGGKVY